MTTKGKTNKDDVGEMTITYVGLQLLVYTNKDLFGRCHDKLLVGRLQEVSIVHIKTVIQWAVISRMAVLETHWSLCTSGERNTS